MRKNKFNIYRIEKKREQNLLQKLEAVGLTKVSEQEIDDYNLIFFFSTEPDEIDIWWADTYKDFLGDDPLPKNRVYFGALILSNQTSCYAISLGKTHFYLRQFCDPDFGLNLAERIARRDNLRVKHSKFYKSSKSKSIIAYHDGSEIIYDSGESMHYLKAGTIDESLWGKTASFGSSVLLHLSISPFELPALIDRIETTLQQSPQFTLPRVAIVRDEERIRELDRKLAQAILSCASDSNINIEEFSISGVNFIFPDDSEYSLYLKGHKREQKRIAQLSIEELLLFVAERGVDLINEINNIMVVVHNPYGRDRTEPLKTFLDFIDDENRYCLIDGKWYKFNQSYVEFLRKEVDKIETEYEPQFDITVDMSESDFNALRAAQDGFINYDRVLERIDGRFLFEKVDLVKGDSLYFVKKGKPQKLVYVVDQSLALIKLLQGQDGPLEIDGQSISVRNIFLWLILERQTSIDNLSDINSIILQMKLVDWKKSVREAGYVPKVKLNYAR